MNHYEPEKLTEEQLLIARKACARDLEALDAEIQRRMVAATVKLMRIDQEEKAKTLLDEVQIHDAASRARAEEAVLQAYANGPPRPWAVSHVPPATEYVIRGERYSQPYTKPTHTIGGY